MVTCGECGAQNRNDAQFCAQCDAYLVWSAQSPAADDTTVETATPASSTSARRPEVPPEPPAPKPAREDRREPARETANAAPAEQTVERGDPVGAVRPAEPRRRERPSYTDTQERRGADATAPMHWVEQPTPAPARPDDAGRRVETASKRAFGRSMRAAAGERRVRYDRRLSTRVLVIRAVLGAAAVLVLVVGLGPWRTSVTSFAGDQAARIIPGLYRGVDVAAVSVEPEQDDLPGFLAAYAVDGVPGRAWAVGFDPQGEIDLEGQCGQGTAGAAGALTMQFAEPSRIDRVTIQAGIDSENPQSARQSRPRTVDLQFSDGSCTRALLDDQFEAQHVDVQVTAADTATIRLLDAYEPREGDGTTIAISEVTFASR